MQVRISIVLVGLSVVLSFGSHAQPCFADTDFKSADSVAALYPGYSLLDLKCLADKLTLPFSTDVQKFRAIYSWVCNNIEDDYDYYLINKRKREQFRNNPERFKDWSIKFSKRVFSKLLNEHKTVCSGYAYLIRELAFHAGLACVVVDGYGRTAVSNIGGHGVANHSWNAVKLDNTWYLCDPTWSSGAIDMQSKVFVKRFDDAYFLSDPNLFSRNHFPLDSAWLFLSEKLTLKEFVNRPLVYSSIHHYQIAPLTPATFDVSATKGDPVQFRFSKSGGVPFRKFELRIGTSTVPSDLQQGSPGIYEVSHVFNARGKYIVHILLDDRHAFTYAVSCN